MKLKTTFTTEGKNIEIKIVGGYPDGKPYIKIVTALGSDNINDPKEIELLAVNILKRLNSKFLKKK